MSKLIRTPSGRTVLAYSQRELRAMFTEFGIVAKRDPSPLDPDYKEIMDLRETLLGWRVMRPNGTLDCAANLLVREGSASAVSR